MAPDPPLYCSPQIPRSLFKEQGYDYREALFGIPTYGGSIAQNVYYAQSDLCDQVVDTSTGVPAREIGKDGKMLPWPSPYILMVDRGGCTFVQKVRMRILFLLLATYSLGSVLSYNFSLFVSILPGPQRPAFRSGRGHYRRQHVLVLGPRLHDEKRVDYLRNTRAHHGR